MLRLKRVQTCLLQHRLSVLVLQQHFECRTFACNGVFLIVILVLLHRSFVLRWSKVLWEFVAAPSCSVTKCCFFMFSLQPDDLLTWEAHSAHVRMVTDVFWSSATDTNKQQDFKLSDTLKQWRHPEAAVMHSGFLVFLQTQAAAEERILTFLLKLSVLTTS